VSYEVSHPVPIPADVNKPDKILAGLTARQVAIAAVAAVIVWAGFEATRRILPLPAFAALVTPVVVAAIALVVGERDGLPLDRLLAAAWRQARSPRRLVTAPEGIPAPPRWTAPPGPQPPLPAPLAPLWQHITADGIIGLGADGVAAVAATSTVNFALRTPAEQDALTAAYGRWLNSLTGPVQILIRAGRADLTGAVAALREGAPALPHPALERAALEHASFLAGLAAERDVLTRQVLLVIREPQRGAIRPGGGSGAARAAQRAAEAARLLAGADLQVRVLDGGRVTALLAACADPSGPPITGRLAVAGQPVTSLGRPA
jgi:PrgI family protein